MNLCVRCVCVCLYNDLVDVGAQRLHGMGNYCYCASSMTFGPKITVKAYIPFHRQRRPSVVVGFVVDMNGIYVNWKWFIINKVKNYDYLITE